MASGRVRWDLEVMRTSIQSLRRERNNLQTQRGQMQAQKNRVDVNWKSPAGQQYQSRLGSDMATIDHIIGLLDARLGSLENVVVRYSSCEDRVAASLRRLPY